MTKEYFFEEKNDLVYYLYSILSNPTQIKVQKTLYLLYAFYGATYGQLSSLDSSEDFDGQNYPKALFEANFQAWKYGPVEFDVYRDEKNDVFKDFKTPNIPSETAEEKNIKQFIDELASQTDKIDDFSLVDRTHQDNSWLDKYNQDNSYIEMVNEEIIEEYLERYV